MFYSEIHKKVADRITEWDIEHFYIVAIKQEKIVGIKKLSSESTIFVSVNPYKIIQYLTDRKAEEYVMIHNHPNNKLSYSYLDVCYSNLFKQIIPFKCRGSLVITKKNYSFIPKIWEEEQK